MPRENGESDPKDIGFKAPEDKRESDESLPREIELKIVNLGDVEELRKKILAAAKLSSRVIKNTFARRSCGV